MKKSNLVYIGWALLLLGVMVGGSQFILYLKAQASHTFIMWPALFGTTLVYFLFGLILGLDNIIREARRSGQWSVRRGKLLGLGIPCLLIWLLLAMPYWVEMPTFLGPLVTTIWITKSYVFHLLSLLLGNLISTSICRQETRVANLSRWSYREG